MTRWWRSHSVRVRLTLWYLAAIVCVLAVYVFVVYAFVSRSASQALDQQLRRDFQWALATLDVEPGGMVTWTEPQLIVGEEELPWVQVFRPGGELLFQSAEAQRRSAPLSVEVARRADERPFIESVVAPNEPSPLRLMTRLVPIRREPLVIQVGRGEDAMRRELQDLGVILVLGLPIAVALAGLGGYTVARRALMPIERMTERAQYITAERLNERLPVHNPDDEMGRLASVFNETLGRLEASFEQMRRFTADVSHQLRTPLTAIRSVGEVGLRGQRDEAAYRSIIGSMLEEVDRLATLVDRLLTLSRAESGQSRLSPEPVDLVKLAEDVVTDLEVLAEEKRQSLRLDAPQPVTAVADRMLLRQAVINLVDNAIKFTPAGGAITVRVGVEGASAMFEVTDAGPGIPADAAARIFDRFYRADDAEADGTGLGLSIAKGAVEAVGGRLVLRETGPAGSTFRITLRRGP